MKVNLNPTKFDSPMKASFKPDLDETGDRARKLLDRLTERYERSNPFPKSKISVRPTEEEISLVDKWNVGFEKQLADKLGIAYEEGTPFFSYDLTQALEKYVRPKVSGEINFTFPETSFAMRPGRDFAESLLHESQHAIQNIEDGSRSGMMSMYRNADQDLKESILSSIDDLNDYNRQRWGRGNDYEPKQGSAIQSRIEKTNELAPNFDQERFMDWLEENSSNPRVGYVAKRSGLTRDAVENGYWADEDFIDILADLRDDGIDTNEFLRRTEKRNYDVDQSYLYKNNLYEREAFEASRRDVDPQYREMYHPKTLR